MALRAPTEPLDLAPEAARRASETHEPAHPRQTPDAGETPSLRQAWQIPSILLSATIIAWMIVASQRPSTPVNIDQTLTEAEQLCAAGKSGEAVERLRDDVEPNLGRATELEQARFHAIVADFLSASRDEPNIDVRELGKRAAESYRRAQELGLMLSTERLERLAIAFLDADQLKEANLVLPQFEQLANSETQSDARRVVQESKHRVLKRVLDRQLQQQGGSIQDQLTLLADYRNGGNLSLADEFWVIARQTELRLQSGDAQAAIDLLLIEMRRLELRGAAEAREGFGELYALLGRAYFELGEFDRAKRHLEHALSYFQEYELSRGEVLNLLGQIGRTMGDAVAALEHFQTVVREFVATPHYFHALLGRAEVQSMLGDHVTSLADYREIVSDGAMLREPRNADLLIASLSNRFDAAIATGKLNEALEYIKIAEQVRPREQLPSQVIVRLASIHRQLGDSLGNSAKTAQSGASQENDSMNRHHAGVYYRAAGEYFLQHSNGLFADSAVAATALNQASDSQWQAAHCFDLGGRQDLAVQHFTRYLQMQSIEDPRRAETMFRLAQAHQALGEIGDAIHQYELLISDRARTPFAAQSYVPLAMCYVAADRVQDARQVLQQVVTGDRLQGPDSRDYRNALVELGRLEYSQRAYPAAIESLSQFVQRYPDDARIHEVRFLLADAYRCNSNDIARLAEERAGIDRSGAEELVAMREEQLRTAATLFAQVAEAQESAEPGLAQREASHYRMASLYRADCAFQLREFSQAIEFYDQVARQYSSHESSMYALIQIVHCYHALGDSDRAAAAHQRAMVRLKQLPDDAFTSPDSLMNRAAWEHWLDQHPIGEGMVAAGAAH